MKQVSKSAWRRAIVLIALARERRDPITLSQLGLALATDHTTIYTAIRQLEEWGLIDRADAPAGVQISGKHASRGGRFGYQAIPMVCLMNGSAPPTVAR